VVQRSVPRTGCRHMIHLWLPDWPRWALMWAMAIAIYISCKWLTWHHAAGRHSPYWKHAVYLLGWPGMDATSFLGARRLPDCSCCRSGEWLGAVGKLIFGGVLLFAIARAVPHQHPYLAGWIGMIGIVLILHFGALHLLSCMWRRIGLPAHPLMNRPLASTS